MICLRLILIPFTLCMLPTVLGKTRVHHGHRTDLLPAGCEFLSTAHIWKNPSFGTVHRNIFRQSHRVLIPFRGWQYLTETESQPFLQESGHLPCFAQGMEDPGRKDGEQYHASRGGDSYRVMLHHTIFPFPSLSSPDVIAPTSIQYQHREVRKMRSPIREILGGDTRLSPGRGRRGRRPERIITAVCPCT